MAADPVIVGTDGSPASTAALRWAFEVAATGNAPVEAVRAWQWPVLPVGTGATGTEQELADAAQRDVDAQLGETLGERPAGSPSVPTRTHVAEGHPGTVLLVAAAHGQLLVLGRHGQSAWQRRLVGPTLGSVTSECLSRSPIPVAVVPAEHAGERPSRVVAGVDGSSSSLRALRWAADHAARVEAPLVAVLAWDLTTLPTPATAGTTWTLPPVDDWEHEAQQVLEQAVVSGLGASAAAGVERVVRRDQPAAGVLSTVQPADLLVLGERAHGGFARLLMGSVSRECVEHAPCPVVVVRSPEREEPSPAGAETSAHV